MSQLVEDSDDKLFDNIRYNRVQPSPRSTSTLARQNDYPYDLRPRRHSFSLTSKTDRRNFVNRLLLKRHYSISLPFYYCICCICLRFVNRYIKERIIINNNFTAFRFRENRRHRTDRRISATVATLSRPLREGGIEKPAHCTVA